MKTKKSWITLVPLILFILLFLGSGIFFNDFYAIPSPIPALIGVIVAVLIFNGKFKDKLNTFVEGCGDNNIITMCLIYLLAGAFTQVTSEIGALNSVVNLTLNAIPSGWLYVGVFVIAAIVSTATGTSVGSIAALGGTAAAFATKTNADGSILGASLLCGAMFGDNLSVVSDTTIAATQTMGCSMSDKMKENLKLALPAAVLSIIVFFFLGNGIQIESIDYSLTLKDFIITLPYLLVIILAISGVNVFSALVLGIISGGIIGFAYGNFELIGFTKSIYKGFTSMNEIFILSLFIGGLAHMVNKEGGLNYMLSKIEHLITRKRVYGVIALLITLVDFTLANNTVTIIISSPIVKKLKDLYNLCPKKLASFIDIYACVAQGIIPYGAQVLLILSFNKHLNYFDLIGNTWYILFLFIITTVYLIFISLKNNSIIQKN